MTDEDTDEGDASDENGSDEDDPFEALEADAGNGHGEDDLADVEDVTVEDSSLDTDTVEEDIFTEMEVEELDDDELWEQLDEGSDSPITQPGEGHADIGGTEPDVEAGAPATDDRDPTDGDVTTVPKRSYCERCEFFSAPPEISCSNPDTEILELVDTEHFRVVDCPVVRRRREVGEFEKSTPDNHTEDAAPPRDGR